MPNPPASAPQSPGKAGLPFRSKLPSTPTSIFTEMSALSLECGAINLSQGFPDYPMSDELIELVWEAMKAGHNQYAPMAGWPPLREAIASKIEGLLTHKIMVI